MTLPVSDPTSHWEKIWPKEPIGYLAFCDIYSSQRREVIINDCTELLPRERRKRQNMTWWLDRTSLCLSDRTYSRPADFPFVSIECELRWPYFLIWHQHWGNLDWNSLTHWFDLVEFEWPFMFHNESVCCIDCVSFEKRVDVGLQLGWWQSTAMWCWHS